MRKYWSSFLILSLTATLPKDFASAAKIGCDSQESANENDPNLWLA